MTVESATARKGLTRGVITVIVVGAVVVVTAIVVVVGIVAYSIFSADRVVGAAVESIEEVDVTHGEVTLTDGVVETMCFSYDMPTFTEYELNPDSQACNTAIRFVDGDSLTEFSVRAQSGADTPDAILADLNDAAEQNGLVVESSVETINGREVVIAESEDGYGLPTTMYFVPLSDRNFVVEDTRIGAIFITGHTGAPELDQALREIVESLTIAP